MLPAAFVTPVTASARDTYIEVARRSWPLWKEHGAIEMRECWGASTRRRDVSVSR